MPVPGVPSSPPSNSPRPEGGLASSGPCRSLPRSSAHTGTRSGPGGWGPGPNSGVLGEAGSKRGLRGAGRAGVSHCLSWRPRGQVLWKGVGRVSAVLRSRSFLRTTRSPRASPQKFQRDSSFQPFPHLELFVLPWSAFQAPHAHMCGRSRNTVTTW